MNLTNSGPILRPADIDEFEREIDGHLAADYKQFLLTTNGGFADPPIGFRWNDRVNVVPAFDALTPGDDCTLRRGLRKLRHFKIDGYLRIASTRNEEDICMAFSNGDGAISLAVYTYRDDTPVEAQLVPLADSFREFCNSLFEIPTIHCPIEELGRFGTGEELDDFLAQGNSIDAIGKNEVSILCEAIKFDNQQMIDACIGRGASLSKSVYFAVINQRPDLVKKLAAAGADVNEKDEFGDRPLYYVGGLAIPGEEGAKNREMHDVLVGLGAT